MEELQGQTSSSNSGLKTGILNVIIKYNKGYSGVYTKCYEYRAAKSVAQSPWKKRKRKGGREDGR